MVDNEHYRSYRKHSLEKINTADRFLNFTYKIVDEPKMLIGVVENLFVAMVDSIKAILYLELKYKFIPPFKTDFDSIVQAFIPLTMKYNIDPKPLNMMKEMRDILIKHKKCPIEFVKKNAIIMCDEDYSVNKLTESLVKSYFDNAKLFIQEVNNIINKNERNYRRFT